MKMQANDVPHSTIVMLGNPSAEPEYVADISRDHAVKQVQRDFETMESVQAETDGVGFVKVPAKFEDDEFESAAEIEHKDARRVEVSRTEMQVELPKSRGAFSGCSVDKDFTGGELEEMGIVNEYALQTTENIKEETTCAIKNDGKEDADVMKPSMLVEEGENLVKSSPVTDVKIADHVEPNLNEMGFETSGRVNMEEASNKDYSAREKQNVGHEEDKVVETEEVQQVEKASEELAEEMDGIPAQTDEVCEDEQFRSSSEDEKWIVGVGWSMEKQVEEEGVNMDEDEDDEEEEDEDSETEEQVQLRQELYDARETVQLADERFQQLQGQLEEEQLRSAQQAEEYMKQVQTLQDEKRSPGEIEELQNLNTTTSDGDASLGQQLKGFQEQLTSLELQNKVMSKEKDFLWAETQELTNCAHELLAEEESLAPPNGHLDMQLKEARRHADDTRNDYERWRAALAECKDRHEQSRRECEHLRNELLICRTGLGAQPEPNDAQTPWIKRIPMAAIALAVALALLLPRLGRLFA
uniref:Sarcolemmal membrane-associated protein n=1 Tax=Eptatretus burgeri TaxID=7764 RepID=A0A8C4QQH9_EPTBU